MLTGGAQRPPLNADWSKSVSYTHLDVYKRQIRNRWEAAVSGANPELADRLFSETLAGTGSYCYRPGDLKESSGKPF